MGRGLLAEELSVLIELPEIDIEDLGFTVDEARPRPRKRQKTVAHIQSIRAMPGEAWQLGPHVLICGGEELWTAEQLLNQFEVLTGQKPARRDVHPTKKEMCHE